MQPLRELETALVAEVDVDERHVRTELRHESNRLGAVGRNPDDVQPFTSEQLSGALEEEGVVVDYDAPHRHPLRIHNRVPVRIPATRNPWASRPASRPPAATQARAAPRPRPAPPPPAH